MFEKTTERKNENSHLENSRYYEQSSKNLSGEKDFFEIDKEIKKTIEGKSLNEASNLSKSDASFNGQTTLYTKQTIWNDSHPKEEENSHYQMKFLNYNNKFLLKKDDNFTRNQINTKHEKKTFNLNEIIATNTNKETQNNCVMPDYSDEVEECENVKQINISKTKTNNLSSLNQKMFLQDNYCKRAFTEPSAEITYGAYNSNHSNHSNNNKFNIKEQANKRMFPLLEGGNYTNEDSFDYSVNEDINSDYNMKQMYLNQPVHPRFIMNNILINNSSNISTNESNDGEEVNKRFLTPKNITNFDRNWVYTQQKLNFQNPNYFNNINNTPNMIDEIRYGKASSFCNPSDYYINKLYNNTNSNIVDNMFSLNMDKVNSDKKKSRKKDDNMDENQNVIFLENILSCKDRRTTLMIKNIPNKYNSISLLEEINVHFKGKYDFFYLPLDFNNNCNLGFAFINFVDPLHILLFHDLFCKKKWKKFKSDKICELAYAKFQGKKELASHFEKSSVMSTSGVILIFTKDNKKPLLFTVTNPLPKVELPMKYIEILKDYYPNCQTEVINNKLVIKSFFRK